MPRVSKKNQVTVINDLRKGNAEQKAEIERLKAEIDRLNKEKGQRNRSRSPRREPGSALQMYQALQLVQRFERDALIEQLCNVIVRLTNDLERLRQENKELREGKGPIGDVMLARWKPTLDISRQDTERIMSQRVRPVYEVFDRIEQMSELILNHCETRGELSEELRTIHNLSLGIYCWASAGNGAYDRGD